MRRLIALKIPEMSPAAAAELRQLLQELETRHADLVKTNQDLSRARQTLLETRQRQFEAIGLLTHDLNQSLSTIVAYAQLSLSILQDDTASASGAGLPELLGNIVTQTARMREINRTLQNLVKQC